jgi:polar amino acid transport system substrate-binding protein
MNMKKLGAILFGCIMASAVLVGCAGQQGNQAGTHDTHIKIGTLTHLNASEERINEVLKKIDEETDVKLAHDYAYYHKLTSMLMGLESGSVNEVSLYGSVAQYLINRNDKLAIVEHRGMNLEDSFCCAVRTEDKQLKADLDKAIGEMKADGTLDKFVKTYITDLKKGEEPPAVTMPTTNGKKLKIAVTGDLPPLDLVLADGTPAGFNTAVLSEIGKRLNMDVELVQIDSAARASALASKKVDVVFWVAVPKGDSKVPADIDKPQNLEMTTPYYQDRIVHVGLKK